MGPDGVGPNSRGWRPHQLLDLRLQVLYAVQLPLAAALGGDPVLAPPPDVVDAVQLLRCQLVHFQQGLEVVAREGNYALCVKWQFYLGCEKTLVVAATFYSHTYTQEEKGEPLFSRDLHLDLEKSGLYSQFLHGSLY